MNAIKLILFDGLAKERCIATHLKESKRYPQRQ